MLLQGEGRLPPLLHSGRWSPNGRSERQRFGESVTVVVCGGEPPAQATSAAASSTSRLRSGRAWDRRWSPWARDR